MADYPRIPSMEWDYGNARRWNKYADHVKADLLPTLAHTDLGLLVWDGSEITPTGCTELGAMLMMNLPLIVVEMPGSTVPERVVRAADEVLRPVHPDTEEIGLLVAAARLRMLESGVLNP